MDPTQASQMIGWLDEELRKSKAQISELRDLLQRQAIELADQRKRFEDLSGRQTRLQADVVRMTQVDQAIQQLKAELAAVLQGVREEMRQHDQQVLQARQVERESEAKAQIEQGQRLERLLTLDDRATVLMTEQQRQNEQLIGLRQRLDGVDKELTRRADQGRLDDEEHKRELARMDAIQQGLESLRSQNESNAARFQFLERWAQGSAQRTADLQAFRADTQRVQSELQEAQRRSEQRVEKQIRDWAAINDTLHRDQEAWTGQLRVFSEQHERTKKALSSVQDLVKELRVAQDEARQAQELGSEKQRRELRDWQGENEKRWTRYLSQWEYQRNEQRKADEGIMRRLDDLEGASSNLDKEFQALRTNMAEQAAQMRAANYDLWHLQLEYMQRNTDFAKAMADKAHSLLGD